jgi:hypothetical protein
VGQPDEPAARVGRRQGTSVQTDGLEANVIPQRLPVKHEVGCPEANRLILPPTVHVLKSTNPDEMLETANPSGMLGPSHAGADRSDAVR